MSFIVPFLLGRASASSDECENCESLEKKLREVKNNLLTDNEIECFKLHLLRMSSVERVAFLSKAFGNKAIDVGRKLGVFK